MLIALAPVTEALLQVRREHPPTLRSEWWSWQVHTRLATAILNKAKADAIQQREALLAEAEEYLVAAAEIDEALRRLESGGGGGGDGLASATRKAPFAAVPEEKASRSPLEGIRRMEGAHGLTSRRVRRPRSP